MPHRQPAGPSSTNGERHGRVLVRDPVASRHLPPTSPSDRLWTGPPPAPPGGGPPEKRFSHDGTSHLADVIDERVRDPRRLAAVLATQLLDSGAEEPFDRLARLAAVTLDAPLAFVTIVDERRSFWKACVGIEASDPADRQNPVEESLCRYVVGLDAELIVGDAATDPRTSDNPSVAAMGIAAWAGFPLRSPDGQALGSFSVVDTRSRDWSDRDLEVLRALAHAASGEIALRVVAEQAAELARTLQETLLPPVTPHVPGLGVGATFRAGGQGIEVMGDFYDVFETADHRWNAVLGDVCGKGIPAARLTGLARYTLRAGAMRESSPSRVLALLDEALKRNDDGDGRFVTAVMVALDPQEAGFAATLSSGGHVPAILRNRDGCHEIGAAGSLLGLLDGASWRDIEFTLSPGDVLVLCTDGVIEARSAAGEQFGLGRLSATIAGAGGDAADIAAVIDGAVVTFAGPVAQDDVAIVVLRVEE